MARHFGVYRCCLRRAFRFDPFLKHEGCARRDHQPDLTDPEDRKVCSIFNHLALEPLHPSHVKNQRIFISHEITSQVKVKTQLCDGRWWGASRLLITNHDYSRATREEEFSSCKGTSGERLIRWSKGIKCRVRRNVHCLCALEISGWV